MTGIQHPWQSGPAELLSHAIQHLHRDSDFDKRMAFLVLDIGVETLLKTFLTLPDEVTKVQGSFAERKKAAEGSFHDLVRGTDRASGPRLKKLNLSHVQFYHDLRNTLYHQGNGITVPVEKAQGYAQLAVDLLRVLLDVDLSDELHRPKVQAQELARLQELKARIAQQEREVKRSLKQLEATIELAIEKIEPKLALPSFARRFDLLTTEYIHTVFEEEDGEVRKFFVMTGDFKRRLEFADSVVELLESVVENPKVRSQLFATGRTSPVVRETVGREIDLQAIARYMIEIDSPAPLDLYLGIVDIVVNRDGPSWWHQYRHACGYPRASYAYHEGEWDAAIKDGEDQTSLIEGICATLQEWMDSVS
jgi:hypothetical protein